MTKPPAKEKAKPVEKMSVASRVEALIKVYREPVTAYPAFTPVWEGARGGIEASELHLEQYRELFEAGNRDALLVAFHTCTLFRVIPPDWILFEMGRAVEIYRALFVRTLDEAFGVSRPKHAKIEGLRNAHFFTTSIRIEVNREHAKGRAKDMILFAEIGESFGISESTCAALYYAKE